MRRFDCCFLNSLERYILSWMSGARPKKEVAPKITSTIMTISKSTPFLIRKHHLDDSQMYRPTYLGAASSTTRNGSAVPDFPAPTATKLNYAPV